MPRQACSSTRRSDVPEHGWCCQQPDSLIGTWKTKRGVAAHRNEERIAHSLCGRVKPEYDRAGLQRFDRITHLHS